MRKEWIANICHDLKTPLSPIKGYSEMMKDGTVQREDEWKHYGRVIHKNAIYMEQLIEDLKWTLSAGKWNASYPKKKTKLCSCF